MTPPRRTWSITVGSIAEIPIRIHASFLALLVWLVLATDSPSPLIEALFVLIVFTCVLLHELGHALVAKSWGVQTKDITLYPFGGIASIVSQPTAKAELCIALAGPLVNIFIATILYFFVTLPDLSAIGPMTQISLPARVLLTNVALAVFNLLPALPMDGGRVLRALLTLLNVEKPTKIAARVSQGLCILLAITALWLEQPMMFIIALIVFLGAMQEHVRVETKTMAASFTVRDAMISKDRLESMTHGITLAAALRSALTSWQPFFPVLNGDQLLGIINREDLLEFATTQTDGYIGEIIDRSVPSIEISASLAEACSLMEAHATHLLIVTDGGNFAGLLAYDRVSDFLFMNEIRQHTPKDEDIEWSNPL